MHALNRPIGWWGPPGRQHGASLSIIELIESGTLPVDLAAYLWQRLEGGASLIVAAGPPWAGKTTLLTALLAFLPPQTRVYFTRGWGETFDLPPPDPAYSTYLLINELSDHLPVYSWGPYARRAFALLAEGYRLAATMHADTPEEVIALLAYDLGVPLEQLTLVDLCLTLGIGRQDGRIRRWVRELATPDIDQAGRFTMRRLARWAGGAWELVLATEPGAEERACRADFLRSLTERRVISASAVQEAIAQYYRGYNSTP